MEPQKPSPPTPFKKKPYTKPKLDIYGDLTEITQSVMGSKMNDGAGHANKHYTS